jgi:hypothetical protein
METEFEYDAYISYRKLYENEAQLLANRLKNDKLKVWIDLWEIKPGDKWQEISLQALNLTRAVLVLIGPEGIGPYGQTEELKIVQRSKVTRIIPVLLPRTSPEIVPSSLKDLIWANFKNGLDDESTYRSLVAGIYGENPVSSVDNAIGSEAIGSDISGGTGANSDITNTKKQPEKIGRYKINSEIARSGMGRVKLQNPYIGPRTFQRNEADRFFGRDREARELLALVESEQLVLFYAQSGAGKSSLINTRLVPSLESKGYKVLSVGRVSGDVPSGINIQNIYIYNLLRSLQEYGEDPTLLLAEFLFLMNPGERKFIDASEPSAIPDVFRQVLIIDQFEELFSTQAESWEKREDFFKQLAEALQADAQLRIVLVMREDYIASLDPYAQLVSNGFRARYSMQRLGREAALEAVKRPAEMMSRPYGPGVAEKLVDDLSAIKVQRPDGTLDVQPGQYVEPVQLQVICYNLWESLSPEGTQITERDIQDVGDVNQSLGMYYDRRVHEVAMRMNVQERLIREWFENKLITAGRIRNMVLQEREKSGGLDDKVIQALQGDLIRAEIRGGATWYELTHDRLVEPILESNRRWFNEHLSPLQRQAALWNEQNRNDSWLLIDQALVEVEAWAKEHPDELTEMESEFLEACRERQAEIGERRALEGTQLEMTNKLEKELAETTSQSSSDTTASAQDTEEEQNIDETAELTPEQIAERAIRLQAAIAANLLANNRSQAVFNDKAQGEDQLGIKNEVEALAETLLLRDVEPPVAVGVMGGWGSGKSFVMYLIDQYVQRIRAQRVKKGWADSDDPSSSLRTGDPKIPVFVGHVYQIHFNAWTYAKSNLWASLMDTIFSCLNRQMQLERLLAHREFSPDKPPSKEEIHASMMAGGDEFKKIYLDNPQLGQDKDLEQWRKNLDHWGQHLLKGTLLWNIMRGQQVETLEKLKDTEEQLNQLKARRDQFEKDRPSNEITAKDLDPTVRKAYLQSIKSFMLAFLSDQLSTTAKDELKKQDVKEEDVQKYLEEAKGLWGGVKTVVTAFRRSKLYLIWTLIFFALTFALPYVWNTYDLEFVQLQVARIISWFLTLLPTLAVVLPWVKKSIEASVEAKKILEGAYVTQQAKHAEEIANATDKPLPQKISELQADISRGSVAAYDALIGLLEAQAEEQRQKIGPSAKYSNLMEFVQSRLDAATYENQLGLMHQVRQDIDELTFSLVDNASRDVFPRGKPRVILYIDDLDRCPPPRVVEMLEAVQLLLNTKLFIVILGLDTRYVTRALEKEYKEILQHEGDPSGLDYIEKIIQIPYRVRAIEKDNLRQYIEKQMDIEKAPEPEPAIPSALPVQMVVTQESQPLQSQADQNQPVEDKSIQDQPVQGSPVQEQPIQDQPVQDQSIQGQPTQSHPVQEHQIEDQPAQEQPVQQQLLQDQPLEEARVPSQTAEPVRPLVAVQQDEAPQTISPEPVSEQSVSPSPSETETPEPPKPLEIELPAAVIQFKQEDLDDLAVCCQKIVLTPRSIKRLVNVFKLMKIFWFRADKDAGIAERDRPRAVKQAAMSLLALSSAYPEVMREVFVHLDVLYRQGQEKTDLFTALNNIKLPPGSAHELSWQLQKYKADISALKAIVGNGQDKFGQLALQDLKLSTFNIVRSFSFVGDPVYWTNDDGEEVSISDTQEPQPTKAKRNSHRK